MGRWGWGSTGSTGICGIGGTGGDELPELLLRKKREPKCGQNDDVKMYRKESGRKYSCFAKP
jgi:hypothetical protein